MRRLLVTGGAGFIGTNFVHYWAERFPADRLVVLDALTYAGCLENIQALIDSEGCRFVHGDIRDESLVTNLMRSESIDTIVHFAAESHVDRSIAGPDAFIDTNVIGTHSLLKSARKLWLDADDAPTQHRFHHVSTDEVYGSLGPDDAPFTERTAYAPNSPYSASKAGSDHLVRAYHETYGLEVTTSNCSNNYGPYQYPEKLIPLMIVNVLNGRPLPVYGDGSNIRDWLYVTDHCRGIDAVIRHGEVGETYNIGGNCERSNLDIVRTVCSLVDRAVSQDESLAIRFPASPAASGRESTGLIRFVTDRLGHDWRYAIDASKIKRDLEFTPKYEFNSGLEQVIAWMLDNEAWWSKKLAD
jgi:dTDP-glucose 4,6-dehydratase